MAETNKKDIGAGLLDILIRGQRAGLSHSEIAEGIRAGLRADCLSLDDALKHGSTVADPAKYARATDGSDKTPRKARPLERDIAGRIERARQEVTEEKASPEYRAKVLRQKRAQIHRVMNERGTNEITANIRGYDVTLLRLPETDANGLRKLKMFVDGNEIPNKQFNDALAEVSGLNDSKTFNAAAAVGKELRDQGSIQGARSLTKAGIDLVAAPGRAIVKSNQENAAMGNEILRIFIRTILSMARSR